MQYIFASGKKQRHKLKKKKTHVKMESDVDDSIRTLGKKKVSRAIFFGSIPSHQKRDRTLIMKKERRIKPGLN